MARCLGLMISVALLAGCTASAKEPIGGNEMKTLQIRWQRLVDEKGRTCDRCGTTETAVEEAVNKLKVSLKGLGIDVVLEKSAISQKEFSTDTLQSNRIWVAGRPIEEWLQASAGQSKCCSTCGESDCRTITVDGKTYEAVPAEFIVRAGLLAGAQLVSAKPGGPCCPPVEPSPKDKPCCPPASPPKAR